MGLRILLFLLITLNMTDNVVGAWLHQQGNAVIAGQMLYVKYLVLTAVFLAFCVDMAYGVRLRRYEWYGMSYLVVTIAFSAGIIILHPEDSAGSRLYLYMFPVVTYFAGAFFGQRAEFGVRFTVQSYLIMYLGLALVFAALNLWLGAIPLWRDYLNYSGFILDVKGFTDATVDGLHGNFFYNFAGQQIPRFLGSFGDPLALSHAGMILVVPLYYLMPRYRVVLCTLVAVIVAASLTRAVFLFLPMAIAAYWYFRERGFAVVLGLSCAGIVLILLFGDFIAAASDNSSTYGHVDSITALSDFLDPVTLLAGSLLSGKLPEFEPGLFNVLFLFGIVPFVLLILFLRGIYRANSGPQSLSPYIAVLILVAVLTLSLISSVFFATTSAWFAWFLAGFVSRRALALLPDATATGAPTVAGTTVGRQVLA